MKLIHVIGSCIKTSLLCFALATATAVYAAEPPAQISASQVKVDINSADAATIAQVLEGVGLVKAEEIVAYRELNGKFSSIEQLTEVTGIGPATVEKNRHLISILPE